MAIDEAILQQLFGGRGPSFQTQGPRGYFGISPRQPNYLPLIKAAGLTPEISPQGISWKQPTSKPNTWVNASDYAKNVRGALYAKAADPNNISKLKSDDAVKAIQNDPQLTSSEKEEILQTLLYLREPQTYGLLNMRGLF